MKITKVMKGRSMIRPRVLGRIAWLFVLLLSWSFRVRFVNRASADSIVSEKENVLYAFFHGDMVPLLHTYRNSRILIPASESRDGEIMARLLKNFGFDVVRGSSKRKGYKALRELIIGMRKGKTVAIPVDGPRGPLHVVKPGIVYLAGLLKAPIVPVAVSAQRFCILGKSWDQLMLPAPFTECIVFFGDPVYVKGTAEEEINEARNKLEACLHGLKHEAQSAFLNSNTGR
jgi:lysophospholipid acyltransferase (LPLAT)-like uncharacterized protein